MIKREPNAGAFATDMGADFWVFLLEILSNYDRCCRVTLWMQSKGASMLKIAARKLNLFKSSNSNNLYNTGLIANCAGWRWFRPDCPKLGRLLPVNLPIRQQIQSASPRLD